MEATVLHGLLKENIWQAVRDYGAHLHSRDVLRDVSEPFVDRLAHDAVSAKADLRELFRKSPTWNEELQAIVINGTRTHDPDYGHLHALAVEIFSTVSDTLTFDELDTLYTALRFFTRSDDSEANVRRYIAAIKALAPKAYRANRKKSRIFKSLCDALGVTDESAGSRFQKLFAEFADELNGRKLDFKLFLSINPAHFLTMSNPKNDSRGSMLTSCHTFNATNYEYNCGCSGYARDEVTMIAFTVDNPDKAELFNNRKTSRQLFMYMVGNGLLLQSRMYNSSGGTYGRQAESDLYRDLVQRELSSLEGVPNLWKTYTYCKDCPANVNVYKGCGFGGYPDWEYEEFDARISIRLDCLNTFKSFEIGTYGLCIKCGEEITSGLYCNDCNGRSRCEYCDGHFDDEDLYLVYGRRGIETYVCGDCRDEYFTYCDSCNDYHRNEEMTRLDNGDVVCRSCMENDCDECADCGARYYNEEMYWAYDRDGNEVRVCERCLDEHYHCCSECGNYVHEEATVTAINRYGNEVTICSSCCDNYYEACDECGEYYHTSLIQNGLCPHCRAEDEEASA